MMEWGLSSIKNSPRFSFGYLKYLYDNCNVKPKTLFSMKDYGTIRRYLLKEQGYEDDVVKALSKGELEELWEHYHEGEW